MKTRIRVRRIAKRAGLAACVAIVVVGAVSLRYRITYTAGEHDFNLCMGGIAYWHFHNRGTPFPDGWAVSDSRSWGNREVWLFPTAFVDSPGEAASIPLWIPFLLVAMPTAFVWYIDRRRIPAGHCPR